MTIDGSSVPRNWGWQENPVRVAELATYAARWLRATTSSAQTVQTYCADLGLPYLLAQLERGGTLVNVIEEDQGIRLPIYEPGARNTTWHLSFLPWLAIHGVDPWSGGVCWVMPEWGRELATFGNLPDHVWPGDVQRAAPLSSAFIRRRAASVRSYYRWHYAMRDEYDNPLVVCSPADIWQPRAAGVPAQPAFRYADEDMDRDDLGRLQVAADQHQGVPGDAELTSAVVATLIATACRGVEVCRMTVMDYRRSARRGPQVRLHPKGMRDERWVSLLPEEADRIDRWLLWRPDLTGRTVADRLANAQRLPHAVPLFCTLTGPRGALGWVKRSQEGHPGRLGEKSIYNLLKRLCERAADPMVRELVDCIHPHGIRAAVATDLIDQGWSLHEVAALLGHSSITTTARYDRRARDRHLPVAAASGQRQVAAIEAARRRALVPA